MIITRLLADSTPPIHIAPSALFTVHGVAITNAMVYTWIFSVIFILGFAWLAKRATVRPKGGLTQIVEIGTDFITDTIENSVGSRRLALQYAPFFVTVFFFIMTASLVGLLPGVGEALTYHGAPAFRTFTADLNGTL